MDVRVAADMQGTNFFFFVPVCDGGGSGWRRGIIFWDSHGERLPSSGEKDGREASMMGGWMG